MIDAQSIAELEGFELDRAVVEAMGSAGDVFRVDAANRCIWWKSGGMGEYRPSSNWRDGGPIIELEGIDLLAWNQRDAQWFDCWGIPHRTPGWDADGANEVKGSGPTPLIAAMRAFVNGKAKR